MPLGSGASCTSTATSSAVPSTKVREIAAMVKAIHASEDIVTARENAVRVVEKLAALRLTRAAPTSGPAPRQEWVYALRTQLYEPFSNKGDLIPNCGELDSSWPTSALERCAHISLNHRTFLQWMSRWNSRRMSQGRRVLV